MQVCFIIFDLSFQMVVISSRSATVDICPCKMFRTRVEPHEPDLLLFALSVRRPETDLPNFLSKEGYKVHDKTTFHGTTHIVSDYHIIWLKYLSNHAEKIQFI